MTTLTLPVTILTKATGGVGQDVFFFKLFGDLWLQILT